MKALGTASEAPQARGTVTQTSPGKRTLVQAQYGAAVPRLSLDQSSAPAVALDAERSAPRPPAEAADLALDCIGAITTTESGGKANESYLHTASGVSASYANVAQQITSKTISILDDFDSEQLAELDLDKKDMKEASRVCWAVRTIWNAAVGDRTATTLEELRQRVDAKVITRSRLTEADLQLMLRGGELFALVREGRHELAAMKDETKDEKAAKKEERARIAGEVAETEIAHDLNMRETDIRVYLSKGSGEDLAAWMRVAVERPPASGEDDRLGQRIKTAAEDEDGWRMTRIDIGGAVQRHLQKQPLDSDLGALLAAI
jgi:hypothetical protein